MPKTIMPAGYRLTVTTWENDADNYATEILAGLSREDTDFYVDVCKAFSRDGPHDTRISNLYEPDEKEIARVAAYARAVFGRFPTMLDGWDDVDISVDGTATDCLLELAGDLGISGRGEFFTRVVDSWQVEYLAQPVELEDVTYKFE